MSTQSAYRSRHPDVLAAFTAAQDATNAYSKAVFAALAEHGMGEHQAAVSSGAFSAGRFLGVVAEKDEIIPDGWRMSQAGNRILAVPDKRTRAGKAAAAALAGLSSPGECRLPGMPGQVLVAEDASFSSRVCVPGVRLLEDASAVYVTWSTSLEAATGMDHRSLVSADAAYWEPVRLSAYWAAIEIADGNKPVLTREDTRG